MANDAPKKISDSRGKKKAERHSSRTRENKARAQARRVKLATRHPKTDAILKKRRQRQAFRLLTPKEQGQARRLAPDGAKTKPERSDGPVTPVHRPLTMPDLTHILTGE